MEKTVGALEARRTFDKVLAEVATHGDRVIVERNGEPVAAVVPIRIYNKWKRDREAFFEGIETIAERANVSEGEAEALVQEAIKAVRRAAG
jgi:prevent-host-death family protein